MNTEIINNEIKSIKTLLMASGYSQDLTKGIGSPNFGELTRIRFSNVPPIMESLDTLLNRLFFHYVVQTNLLSLSAMNVYVIRVRQKKIIVSENK